MNKTLICGIMALMCLGVWGCFGEPSTGPTNPPDPPKDYRVWFWVWSSTESKLFSYHTATRQIDSIETGWYGGGGLSVSYDGRYLYALQGESVTLISTDSLQPCGELPYKCRRPVVSSPSGLHLALLGDDIKPYSIGERTHIWSDSVRPEFARFSSDGTYLYGISGWESGGLAPHVWWLEVNEPNVTFRRKNFSFAPFKIVVTPDRSKWLLYMRLPALWTYAFEVYDAMADSIIFHDLLTPGAGEIAMTSDGRYAFYGNPGTLSSGPPATSDFKVFDIENNRIERVVNAMEPLVPDSVGAFPVGPILITPDDRFLFVMPGVANQLLQLYDLRQEQFVDFFLLGWDKSAKNPSIQLVTFGAEHNMNMAM